MKTSISSQKGQGLLEYALLIGFVAAIFMYSFAVGGFSNALENLFGIGDLDASTASVNSNASTASNTTAAANATSTAVESVDVAETVAETSAVETVATVYETLNWQEVIMGVQAMYGGIANPKNKNNTPDKALGGEINLFEQIIGMTEGKLASTNAEDGTKDWETFISMIEKTKKANNFSSSYKRGEETISIERIGNSNAVQIKYSDKENVVYYKLSPDANNVMQVETNSSKSYSEFFKTIKKETGWEYN